MATDADTRGGAPRQAGAGDAIDLSALRHRIQERFQKASAASTAAKRPPIMSAEPPPPAKRLVAVTSKDAFASRHAELLERLESMLALYEPLVKPTGGLDSMKKTQCMLFELRALVVARKPVLMDAISRADASSKGIDRHGFYDKVRSLVTSLGDLVMFRQPSWAKVEYSNALMRLWHEIHDAVFAGCDKKTLSLSQSERAFEALRAWDETDRVPP